MSPAPPAFGQHTIGNIESQKAFAASQKTGRFDESRLGVVLSLVKMIENAGITFFRGQELGDASRQMLVAELMRCSSGRCDQSSSVQSTALTHTRSYWRSVVAGIYQWSVANAYQNWSMIYAPHRSHSNNYDIAMFSFASSHSTALRPLAKRIALEDEMSAVLFRSFIGKKLPRDEMRNFNKETGISVVVLDSVIDWRIFRNFLHCLAICGRRYLLFIKERVECIKKMALRLHMSPITIRSIIEHYLLYIIPLTYRNMLVAQKILNQSSFRVAVLGNDFCNRGRSIIQAARSSNIPTITIQHGVISSLHHYIPFADYMAVWGHRDYNLLTQSGVSGSRLIVAGSPLYDPIIPSNNIYTVERDELARRNEVMLVGTAPMTDADIKRAFDIVVDAIRKVGHLKLILRPHPLDNNTMWERLSRNEVDIPIRIERKGNFRDLLVNCRLGIVLQSTATLDFLIRGIPVATILPANKSDPTGMREYDAISKIENSVQLVELIRKIQASDDYWNNFNSKRSELIHEYGADTVGSHSKTLYTLIKSLDHGKVNY